MLRLALCVELLAIAVNAASLGEDGTEIVSNLEQQVQELQTRMAGMEANSGAAKSGAYVLDGMDL